MNIFVDKYKDDVLLLVDLSNSYKLSRMIQLKFDYEMQHKQVDDWLLKQQLIE
jgi:hypothetical protein